MVNEGFEIITRRNLTIRYEPLGIPTFDKSLWMPGCSVFSAMFWCFNWEDDANQTSAVCRWCVVLRTGWNPFSKSDCGGFRSSFSLKLNGLSSPSMVWLYTVYRCLQFPFSPWGRLVFLWLELKTWNMTWGWEVVLLIRAEIIQASRCGAASFTNSCYPHGCWGEHPVNDQSSLCWGVHPFIYGMVDDPKQFGFHEWKGTRNWWFTHCRRSELRRIRGITVYLAMLLIVMVLMAIRSYCWLLLVRY